MEAAPARMPRQIPFIIANEGCERFSFYGMRNILQEFLAASLLTYLPVAERDGAAKDVFHTFVVGVYFFPLLGGWLADRFFGKYHTILWFSLLYSAGQGCLAAFPDNQTGFYTGLFLIALGAGGIKPLVASFMGDQFDGRTKHLAKAVFDAFYWIINFGSFFASLLMPIFLHQLGPRVAFGIPGALMLVSTIVFFAARDRYVRIAPQPPNPNSFLRVVRTALVTRAPGRGRPGLVLAVLGVALAIGSFGLRAWLDWVPVGGLAIVFLLALGGAGTALQIERARGAHSDEAVDGVKVVLRMLVVFALVTPFWSLFDQKASTWVVQAGAMAKPSWVGKSQMQALNPALVMILIPLNNFVIFPALRRRGSMPTALKRMTVGMASAAVAWVIVGALQLVLDSGTPVSIFWQILPYAFLTMGEALVSATGLEFAYSQAPMAMKGVLMAFWSLAVAIGNLWVLLVDASVKSPAVLAQVEKTGLSVTAFQMFFFALFAFAAALGFRAYARRYREVDNYRA